MNPTPEQTQQAVELVKLFCEEGHTIDDAPTPPIVLACDKILLALSSAQSELTELRKDKERLDWLEKQPTLAFWQGTFSDSEYNIKLGRVGAPIFTLSTMDDDGEQSEHDEIGHGQSFRSAIDSAMQPTTKNK